MVKSIFASAALGAALLGCAPNEAPPAAEAESSRQAPLSAQNAGPVQAGANLLLLGVTSDNHALYQDGESVYATALKPGATKQLVGRSPPGITAFVFVVGKVAFCWTSPDRSVPGFGVSPLVVWSAASGPHEASPASPIGTFATSASDDGRSVLFPTNANADGTVGDLELASTDLSERTTLLAALPMGFPLGYCRPFAALLGRHGRARPVALHCEGGATTATLSSWNDGERVDLLGGVATPPFFAADDDGRSFFTTLAGPGTPVVVSDRGATTALDEVRSRRGFFGRDGDVVYTAVTPAGAELRRATPGDRASVETLAPNFVGVHTVLSGSQLITEPWTSPDGRKLPYLSRVDPTTGLGDMQLADARGGAAPRTIDAQAQNLLFGPPFSDDSRHLLFARLVDFTNGTGPMLAAGDDGAVRQFSDDAGWSYLPASGGLVSFNDNARIDPANFALSTADLKVVDLSCPGATPRLIAPAAKLTYFASHKGRRVAFTTDRPGATAGLYSVKVDD